MPLIKSAIKRAKQNEQRRKRLLPYRTIMKTMIRRIVDLTKAGKQDEAAKHLSATFKAIDTAAKKNIIHPKNAARKKARVSKLISS